ncbi:RIO1 family regulatory kinase/ATPase domain-containing protein [Salinicola rhizosphaerae]|uniref:non-specific serine/threonine protein kinase n=1 Tax=Salinicola rhizosphaerae TaxID=1443141 RepID=A0ABQ3E928_9GAMM|nr:RIO1 family regulatory kinase/ATPase [Salinicola rhizosphaerae]GHB27358.1 hypothetical protein GCM10009038_27530 [Salinicola rhizosphaerae]
MGSLPDLDRLVTAPSPAGMGFTQPPHSPIVLQRGHGLLKADVVLVAYEGKPAVMKDYRRHAGSWMALPARLLIRHETHMLERLRAWPHSPRVVGHVGKLAMLMEYVPGEMLSDSLTPANPLHFAQLMTVMSTLHAASIVHNDMRGSNVIVNGGRLVLIDFASALYLPGGRLWRILLKPMRRSDMANVLKFKRKLTGEDPTADERRLGAKPAWIRRTQRVWKKRLLPRLKARFASGQ